MAEVQTADRAGRWFDRLVPYAIGLLGIVLAAGINVPVDPEADTRTAFLLLLVAVMAAAWHGGLLPGLSTTLLSALVGDYLFASRASFSSGHRADAAGIGFFLLEGSLISILGGQFRAARRKEQALSKLSATQAAIALDNAQLYREAQKARASAEAASGRKDEFLATLSHELRTPLTAIVGWAHLLQRGQLSTDETTRAVETIIRNATAQSQIIDELLDVSRIITGDLQLDLRSVDVAAVVRAVIATVTPAASAKGISLQLIQNPAGNYVMGDPERLEQVFWNLFSNAIKFTPKDGRVRAVVESVGPNVEVVIADTGAGIDAEFFPRLFDRFTQDDSSSTRPARGLGLGLSIARRLVELHGGSITAESPGVGLGSTFTVRFPGSPAMSPPLDSFASSPAGRMAGREAGPGLKGVRVLVADDDADARLLIEKVLEIQGAIVKTVSSAREALDVLGRERVDVLLSDIEMPGTDGCQLIKDLRLRPSQEGGSVPAAALTSYARTEDRLRALRAGFQLHLAKPVQPSELVTVVARLAARRNL